MKSFLQFLKEQKDYEELLKHIIQWAKERKGMQVSHKQSGSTNSHYIKILDTENPMPHPKDGNPTNVTQIRIADHPSWKKRAKRIDTFDGKNARGEPYDNPDRIKKSLDWIFKKGQTEPGDEPSWGKR